MKKIYVKDIMIPLSDYATIPGDASLFDAIKAFENAITLYEEGPYQHRALLVLNRKQKVVGKISEIDIMKALEPNYNKIGSDLNLAHFGFSATFLKAMREKFDLWERSLDELCRSVDKVKISDVMYAPADHQRVKENDPLVEAIHQIVMGQHHSLLVIKGKEIVGILRSTDVFKSLCSRVLSCKTATEK